MVPNNDLIFSQLSSIAKLYRRIYKLKVRQVVVILFVASGLLYFFDYLGTFPGTPHILAIFTRSPFPALADACLTSAIVGFTFEILVRSEAEAGLQDMIRELLKEQTDAILEGIPGVLLSQEKALRALREPTLEKIVLRALQLRLSDDRMAAGIFDGVVRKAIAYKQRWMNLRHEIIVRDIVDAQVPEQIRKNFFDVIIRVTYYTKLSKTRFVFVCVNTPEQFNELMENPNYEFPWMIPPSDFFEKPGKDVFEVLQVFVDKVQLEVAIQEEKNGRFEIVYEHPSLIGKVGQDVTVNYVVRVKAERIGHLIYTTVVYPTYDVAIEFDFARASIDYVDVIDYFVAAQQPSIRYIPDRENPSKITVQLKDWALPKSGAIFVWSLKEEVECLE